MVCDICEAPMREGTATEQRPYAYALGGLPHVGIVGISFYECPNGHGVSPVIPRIAELHRVLVGAFVRKPAPLLGAELRFLRKHAGFSAQKFAALLAVDPAHLSRVEHDKAALGASTDRLARAIVLAAAGDKTVRDLLLKQADERLEKIRPLRRPLARMEKNRWKVGVA